MKCQRCKGEINDDEAREIHGQIVCEDCYIDIVSKPVTCDPWAVHSAKKLSSSNDHAMTEKQSAIVNYLKKNGPTPPDILAVELNMSIDEFEREMASLRHMEKVRAQLREGRKLICLW